MAKKKRSAAQKAATRKMLAAAAAARGRRKGKKRASKSAVRRTKRTLKRIATRRTGQKTRAFRVKGRMLISTTRNKRTGRRRKHWTLAVRSNPSQKAQKSKSKHAEKKLASIAKKHVSKGRAPQELKATASAVAQGFAALDSRLTHVEHVQKQHTVQISTLDSHMRNVRGRVVALAAAARGHVPARLVEGARKGAFTQAMARQMAAERRAHEEALREEEKLRQYGGTD